MSRKLSDTKKQKIAELHAYIRYQHKIANPMPVSVRITGTDLDDDQVLLYRNLDCPAYDACVYIAGISGWQWMSCRACSEFRKHHTPIFRKERVTQNGNKKTKS